MTYVAGEPESRLGLSAVLVRPDGVVAWVSETAGDDEGLPQVALQWIGEP
jgi:hypothetical protein